MKKTPLYRLHTESLKAKMAPFAGFDMPLQYTSAKDEIRIVRQEAGIFDVSHMGEFFLTGEQTSEFVDYIITNDYSGLQEGKAVYSPMCNENGGIIDDLIVYKLSKNSAFICVNAANIETDWNWIKSHASKFNVNIENRSNEYSLIAVQGPLSESILKSSFPNLSKQVSELSYYGVITDETENQIIARTGYTGEDGFEVFIPNEVAEKTWNLFLSAGAKPCGLASRDTLRLEVCYPLYGQELLSNHNPKESALGWTLKKNEVNYIGKNMIEKSEPKSLLIKLSLEKTIPRAGYKVLAGDEIIGEVTSGTFSPTISQGIAIARVKKMKNIKEEDLLIEIRGKKYPAKYHTKAFYAGGIKK